MTTQRPDSTRRRLLQAATAAGALGVSAPRVALARAAGALPTVHLPFENGDRRVEAYPGKRPLIVLTERPVQLETPISVFDDGVLTPNDAFFVRWHLSNVPTRVDPGTFRLKLHGMVKSPLTLSLAQLENEFEPVEFAAVCECSGNSRALFQPRVAGGQWGNGAMGNARWRGVRLRDLLDKAGVQGGAVQVRFNGLDAGPLPTTPDFIKAIDLDLAREPDVIVAYRMNGQPLPLLNGYPLRLVVPGWYSTYWVKMLDDIEVIGKVDDNFWMKTAYRIPDNACGCTEPGKAAARTVPISRLTVRSFVTSHADGARVPTGRPLNLGGIAFDEGFGIQVVLLSTDRGATWRTARLGPDEGRYGFRRWEAALTPARGTTEVSVLAINRNGESQRFEPRWNSTGYMRNRVETIRLNVA